MKISTKICYALRILSVLAENYPTRVISSSKIAKQEGISKKYADNLLAILENSKIVSSHRGPRGGYFLTRPPGEITIKEILEVLEGQTLLVNCFNKILGCRYYSRCNIHSVWLSLKDAINDALNKITLADIVKRKEIYFI